MRKNRFQLRNERGEIEMNNDEILRIQDNFYKKLYRSRRVNMTMEYLEELELGKLSEEDKQSLEQEITEDEIKRALDDMPLDKVPGVDGMTTNFLVEFWEEIKGVLVQVIIKAAKEGFPVSMDRAIISLLEKSNRDLLWISNWRPISLLDVDFKLLSKVLANRMKKVMPTIIHKDQVGFIKNRGLCDNVLDLLTALEYCETKEIDALLMSFDFEKAFDSVEHNILFEVMNVMNFGEKFISYLESLFRNMTSCTINKGYSKEYFKVTRALRQGDPVSVLCFDLLAEVIGQKIRQNNEICGILHPKQSKKQAQYADDLWALIRAKKKSYNAILKEFEDFEKNTGLKVNYNKTEVLWVGSGRYSDAKFYSDKPVQWSEKTKILGFVICKTMEQTLEENLKLLIEKMQKVLNMWTAGSLTVMGRIVVFNSLIVSTFIQKLICLPMPPQEFYKKVKRLLLNFIWLNKKTKI